MVVKREIPPIIIARDGGVSFSEVMHGFFSTQVGTEPWTERTSYRTQQSIFQAAVRQAALSDSRLRFFLTILAYDVNALTDIENSSADIEGSVNCRALSAQPLLVMPGSKFKLFTKSESVAASQNLCYALKLRSVEGKNFFLRGIKVVDSLSSKGPWFFWTQTTTLYVTVFNGSTPDEERIVGRGIIKLDLSDFAQEIRSVETLSSSRVPLLGPLARFVEYFATQSAKYVAMPLLPPLFPDLSNVGKHPYKSERYPDMESYYVTAEDGVITKLVHWNKGGKGPVLLIHGAGEWGVAGKVLVCANRPVCPPQPSPTASLRPN